MKTIWFMRRLIEKCWRILKYTQLSVLYHPDGFVHIFGPGKVTLEDNVSIGDGTIICAAQDIVIGKNTMIAAQCYIIDCNHGMHMGKNMREQPLSVHPTKIGEDVWLGCGCKILAGAEISDGAVIGAGTVISGKVEENTICFTKREYCEKARK